jgi:hypothetical protein
LAIVKIGCVLLRVDSTPTTYIFDSVSQKSSLSLSLLQQETVRGGLHGMFLSKIVSLHPTRSLTPSHPFGISNSSPIIENLPHVGFFCVFLNHPVSATRTKTQQLSLLFEVIEAHLQVSY